MQDVEKIWDLDC